MSFFDRHHLINSRQLGLCPTTSVNDILLHMSTSRHQPLDRLRHIHRSSGCRWSFRPGVALQSSSRISHHGGEQLPSSPPPRLSVGQIPLGSGERPHFIGGMQLVRAYLWAVFLALYSGMPSSTISCSAFRRHTSTRMTVRSHSHVTPPTIGKLSPSSAKDWSPYPHWGDGGEWIYFRIRPRSCWSPAMQSLASPSHLFFWTGGYYPCSQPSAFLASR